MFKLQINYNHILKIKTNGLKNIIANTDIAAIKQSMLIDIIAIYVYICIE